VDHYQFRAAAQAATQVHPLMLSPCGSPKKWFARDYDSNDMYNVQRELFALGPSAVTSIPSGVSSGTAQAGASGSGTKRRGAGAKAHVGKKKLTRGASSKSRHRR
jgi:hypothetical protein